jgi:DNA repair protein RecO (recombination protein O)
MNEAPGRRHAGGQQAAAFVLHTYPYRETSLIVEALTRSHGRLPMVARGVRRPKSQLRGQLLPFQPLLLSWAGRAELKTLVRAEWISGQPSLEGRALMCGFYLNELLMRLLPREDPHEALFDHYRDTLQALAQEPNIEAILRRFETRLLKELGYAMVLDRDALTGEAIDPSGRYTYLPERGPVPLSEDKGEEPVLFGKTLLDMAQDRYDDPQTQQQSKALMRVLINRLLGGQPLHTRQLLKELQQL